MRMAAIVYDVVILYPALGSAQQTTFLNTS